MITLFTGPNSYAIAEVVHSKLTSFTGETETLDASELEPRQLPDLFMGATFFSPQRRIVIKNPSSNKPLWSDLEQWIERVPDETEIILIDPQPDKRTKTYKSLQKHASIVEYKNLDERSLVVWIQQFSQEAGQEIPADTARYFIGYVGHDQWRLRNEFEKLLLAEKPITEALIQEVTEPYPEASAFELLDSVFSHNQEKVEELITQLRQREDPYQFFGLLSSQVAALYAIAVSGTRRANDIASDMGLHPFVVSKLSNVAKRLGSPQIKTIVSQLADCDMQIKTSGVDPWYQLEISLLRLSAGH